MKLGVAIVLSRRTWILACLPSVSAENHSRTDTSKCWALSPRLFQELAVAMQEGGRNERA